MTLDDLLAELRRLHIVILLNGRLWSLDRRVIPFPVRLAVRQRWGEIIELLLDGDVRTCCDPEAHRQEWYHAGKQQYRCAICERTDGWWRYEGLRRRRGRIA